MTGRLEFREGRRLRAADLNGETSARDADLDRHLGLAHPAHGTDPGLVGHQITSPSRGPSVSLTPTGPAAGVRVSLGDDNEALRLGSAGGHHAYGSVTSSRANVVAKHAVRLLSRAAPGTEPVPWSLRALNVLGDDGRLLARELRIELSAPPGSPLQDSRVAVGTVAGGAFSSVMAVDAGGSVTVTGDLEVAGSVSQGQIPPDPQDPRFAGILRDLVARRVVAAAVTAPNPMFHLHASRVAASSNAQKTAFSVTLTPDKILVAWCAALVSLRQGSSQIRLLRVGNNAPQGTDITIQGSITWSPDLSAASPATLAFDVAAFDLQGGMAALRFEVGPLTG